ncbi:Imm43 family immunity protein [Niabella terrae]
MGVLAEHFTKEDPFPPMKYSWTKPRDVDRVYPAELLYILKGEEAFNIDYSIFWDGYIVSDRFKSLIDQSNCPPYKSVKLEVINTKGKDISQGKTFFFIDMRNSTQDIIDYSNSTFTLDENMINMRGLSVESVYKSGDYFGNIKKYEKVLLLNNVTFNIFKLKDLAIHDLVCDESFQLRIEKELDSIKCVNLSDLGPYNNRFSG